MIIKIGKMAVTAAMLVGTGLAVADVEWKWDESQHVNIAPATVMVSVASVLPNTVQTLNTRLFGTYGYSWRDSVEFGFHARKSGLVLSFR